MTLTQIAYYQILNKPLMFYLGIFTLISFLITASIPKLHKPMKYHFLMAKIAIGLAIIHGILAVSLYL